MKPISMELIDASVPSFLAASFDPRGSGKEVTSSLPGKAHVRSAIPDACYVPASFQR
jgi:hypothetical protein